MKNLNTNWPPKHSCKQPFLFWKELEKDSVLINAKVGGKNNTREEDNGIEI